MRHGHWPVRESGVVNLLRLLAVALLLCTSAAHALLQPVPNYRYGAALVNESTPRPEDWRLTLDEACAQALSHSLQVMAASFSSGTVTACTVGGPPADGIKYLLTLTPQNGGGTLERFSPVYREGDGTSSCPANSTAVTGGCQCNANYQESGGQCVPKVNKCTAQMNKPQTVNWTLGWTRTPDDTDSRWVGGSMSVPPSGGMVCVEGCEVGVNLTLSGPPQKSQTPAANGLYRVTAPFEALGRGSECTQNTKDADKSTPIMPCPGYVGEIDGKVGCFGTAEKPVTTADKPIPGGQAPIAGNPPAGTPATSGVGPTTGAGRTPTTGTGGNDGGPAAAATGGKGGGAGGSASGTGTTTNGEGKEEPTPCGAPGQPVCAVKVDEAKTPTDGGDGMKTTGLDQAMDKAVEGLQKATNPGGMDTGWGGIPQWFNNEACTPWQLGTLPFINIPVVINICAIQPVVIAVMTFLWVVGTFFAIVGMVARVTGSGVH